MKAVSPPLAIMAPGRQLRSNIIADFMSCFDRLASKSLPALYIASVAG